MRRTVHFAFGALLIASAIFCARQLWTGREMLVLAAVSPGIVAAAAYGTLLVIRSIRPPG